MWKLQFREAPYGTRYSVRGKHVNFTNVRTKPVAPRQKYEAELSVLTPIPEFRRLRQEDHDSENNLVYGVGVRTNCL